MAEAREVTLRIPGTPVPKGRARRGRGGRFFTPRRTTEYEETVAWACRALRVRFGNAKVRVAIRLRSSSALRGDVDNYAKAILDGMQAGQLIDNDRQVTELHVAVDLVRDELENDHAIVHVVADVPV